MAFKNETSDSLEICIPVAITGSVRFWIDEGEELTAATINDVVDQAALAAESDVIRLINSRGDLCMSILGVEPGATAGIYNREKDGETPLPDGVEYADAKQFVYTLTIDHRHGTNTTVHRTREGADAELATFCRQYAADDAFITNADDMDDATLIETYFTIMNERDEFYSIERAELLA